MEMLKGKACWGGRQEVHRGWNTVVGGVQEEWHKMGLGKGGLDFESRVRHAKTFI